MTGHDEVHSLSKNMDGADVRFWMGFGDHYINVFTVLKNLGSCQSSRSRRPRASRWCPLKVVKAVLPDPASLRARLRGQDLHRRFREGPQDGREHAVFHLQRRRPRGKPMRKWARRASPIRPAFRRWPHAMLIASGEWDVKQMANVEELPPRPFLDILNRIGLPTASGTEQGHRALSFSERPPGPGRESGCSPAVI